MTSWAGLFDNKELADRALAVLQAEGLEATATYDAQHIAYVLKATGDETQLKKAIPKLEPIIKEMGYAGDTGSFWR